MAGKSTATERIRNIALVGHGGSGKTSLAEAMLFLSGATSRLGRVADGQSILDFEPEEHKRGGSVATSLAWMDFQDHKINVLDTPGDQNFIHDAFAAMRGADAVVVVVSAPDGVEVQTEAVVRQARALGLPVVFFVNKMDRERADAGRCLADIKETFGVRLVPLQVPLGREDGFRGVCSLFLRKALVYARDGSGRYEKSDIPSDLVDAVDGAWENLVESVAETDEALLEQYLETFELSGEAVRRGFHDALKTGRITPVLFGAATEAVGALALLELVTWAFPTPSERAPLPASHDGHITEVKPGGEGGFVAQVIHTHVDEHSGKQSLLRIFRGAVPRDNQVQNTTRGAAERLGQLFSLRGRDRENLVEVAPGDIVAVARLKATHTGDTLAAAKSALVLDPPVFPPPMMSYVLHPEGRSDHDRIRGALDKMLDEDPTLSTGIDELTHEIVLHGMGQAHLDMAVARMARKYTVQVTTALPPVPYRETLRAAVTHVEGKHKKQTGGAGQYGVVTLNVTPLARGGGFRFDDHIKGGAIPGQFVPSVEKGIVDRMRSGFLAGYPIVDIAVTLVDGKYHPVDSKDVAFQMAGSKGLRAAFAQGGAVLLEPVMSMEIVVPTDVMGDVAGDVTSRRGRVTGMDARGRSTVIRATVPLAEVLRYAPDLRGLSGGKGSFTMHLAGYEEVPPHRVDAIVHASPFLKHDDED
jgi:elongation factor G